MKIKNPDVSDNPLLETVEQTLLELKERKPIVLLNNYPETWNQVDITHTDLCCWANVLNVIDEILENQLKLSEKMDIKFVVDCLHLTEVILSNTTASYGSYQSLDRLGDLLDVDDLDVLEATLRVLATYLLSSEKNSVFGSDKAERKKIAKQLTPFLNIWEGKLSTLLSVDCDISIESNSNLFFQFIPDVNGTKQTISVPNIHNLNKSTKELTDELIEKFSVPNELHFPLKHGVRMANCFHSLEYRTKLIHIHLDALSICVSMRPSSIPQRNYAEDLIDLIHSKDISILPYSKRLAVITCLSMMRSNANPRFISVLRTDCTSGEGMIPTTMRDAVSAAASGQYLPLYSRQFVAELMRLIISYTSSYRLWSSTRFILTLTPGPFLSLLSYKNIYDSRLSIYAAQIFGLWFEGSQTAFQTFTDNNGISIILQRCNIEISAIIDWYKLSCKNDTEFEEKNLKNLQKRTFGLRKNNENPRTIHHLLLKEFLSLLLSTFHSPWRSMGNGVVGQLIQDNLHKILSSIIKDWKPFSPRIYSLAIRLVTEFIQTEPSSYGLILETGLIGETLDSIVDTDCPYEHSLAPICNVLNAICISKDGIKEVKSRNTLQKVLKVLESEKHATLIKPRICTMLGSGFSELIIHHSELKEDTLNVCLEIIQNIIKPSSKNDSKNNEDSLLTLSKQQNSNSSILKRNLATFLESFFANGFDLGNDKNVITTWIDVLLEMYSLTYGQHSILGPSRTHSCVAAIIGLANNHLGIVLRRVFEMIDREIKQLPNGDFPYDESTCNTICSLDNLISLLVRLAKPSEIQQPESLQELGTLNSLLVFQSMGEAHRILLWELSKLDIDSIKKPNSNSLRERRRLNIRHSDLIPRSPLLMRERDVLNRRLNRRDRDRDFIDIDGGVESSEEDSIDDPFGRVFDVNPPQSSFSSSPVNSQQKNRLKNTMREKLLDLTQFIHQLSLSLLEAASFLGDPAPIIGALAKIFKGHFEWLNDKKYNEFESEEIKYIPVLYLGGMMQGLHTLLGSSALLLKAFHQENGIQTVIKQCHNFLFKQDIINSLTITTDLSNDNIGNNNQIHSVFGSLTKMLKQLISNDIKQRLLAEDSSNFNAKDFLKDLYCVVLEVFLPLWKQSNLEKFPQDFISDLFTLCATFLQGSDAFLSDLPETNVIVPDANLIQQLENMGFSRINSEDVLRRTENNFEAALDRLLTGFTVEPQLLVSGNEDDNIGENNDDEDEDDELAMAMALSMGSPLPDKKQKVKLEEKEEKELESKVTIPELLEKLNENLLEDCVRLLYVSDISHAFYQFLIKFADDDEKGNAIIKILSSSLLSKDNDEYLYNTLFTLTLLSMKNNQFRKLINENDVIDTVLLLIEKSLINTNNNEKLNDVNDKKEEELSEENEIINNDDKSKNFKIPKWLVISFLFLSSHCELPSNYTQEESENIKSICSLSKEQQEKSMNFSIKLLKQKLDPSLSQAILQLINLLTRNLEQAINFMENDGLNLLFHLPKASNFNALPTILVHILRHIIDDLPTLQISMEREIGLFLKHIIPNNEETLTPKAFLGTFSHLVHRNVDVFISAASNCCEINSAISMKVTRLTEQQQQVQEDTSSSKIKSKKKKPIFITKNKIESKNSEGLIKIIPMVAQSLINLVEYHKKKENSSIEDEYIVGALTLPNLISFLQEFTEGYESCSKLLTNDKEFLDKLTVSNFIGYLLQNVLPHPVELLTERSSNIEKFHHLSNFFVALWNNPQSRPLILTEISNSLKSLLNEQKESEDSYFATIEQLCSLIGLADLITSLLDTSVVFDDTANDRAKLPDLILESEIISKFVDSLDIVDLDRKEASRVFQRLLPALDAAIHVVISRSNSVKNSTDSLLSKEPSLNDSSRNIFEANRWHDVGEWTVENEDSSDIIHVGDEDERDLDGDMEEDDDEEDEDDDEEEEEEEEEDIDMLSDEPSMQDFFNSYPASLMERDISDFEHLFPLLNQNRDGRSSHLRVFTGGSYGLSSNSSYGARRDEISMQHPLLVPSRSIDSSHRSRLLDSIFNNAEAAFRNNNISRSPMQILRSLGVTIPPFLVSRIRQWLESGQLTTSHLEYAFGFEERLISSLITESAKEKREAIFSGKEKEKEEKELDDKKEDKKSDIEESQSSEISSNTEIPIPTIPSNSSVDSEQLLNFLTSALSSHPSLVPSDIRDDGSPTTITEVVEANDTPSTIEPITIAQEGEVIQPSIPVIPDSESENIPLIPNIEPPQLNNNDDNNNNGNQEVLTESQTVEATPPPPPERQAIDMDVLAELPPEIREEILANQQAIESAMNSGSISGVNQEFLQGLPVEMQAEVLAQQGSDGSGSSLPGDMDMSTFLATLPDDLREEILTTMDETMLNSLPSHFIAEAQAIRSRRVSPFGRFIHAGNNPFSSAVSRSIQGSESKKIPQFKDYDGEPLLSEEDLVVLTRLLYLNESSATSELPKLFRNLCKHPLTRQQLLSIFVYILSATKSSPLKNDNNINCLSSIDNNNNISSSKFSPITNPCKNLIGFQEGSDSYSYSSSSNCQSPPQTVLRRIIGILDFLTKKIPKVMEFMFSPFSGSCLNLLTVDSVTTKNSNLPVSKLFSALGQQHIVDSSQTLESFIHLISIIFSPLEQFKNSSTDIKKEEIEENEETLKKEEEEEKSISDSISSNTEEKKETKNEKEEIISQPKPKICPEIPISELCNLPRVFTLKTCTEKTYKCAMKILRRVCANEKNRGLLLSELHATSVSLSKSITEELSKPNSFDTSSGSFIVNNITLPQGLPFLRLLKLMVTLDGFSIQNDYNELWKYLKDWLNSGTILVEENSTADISSFSILLPIIESFFVVHQNDNELESSCSSSSLTKSQDGLSTNPSELVQFMKQYKLILNYLIKQNPELLEGTFSSMTKYPTLLDFDVKRSFFRSQLSKEDRHFGGISLKVRRDRLFEDSYHQIKPRTADELKGRLTIQFVNEPGIDAGGLLKDWYQELSRQIFNPGYALFIQSADSAFQPNKDSQVNAHHLDFFEFCGRVIGKAIYDGANMDVHFTRSFYKHILGKRVVWKDMEAVDPEYYKNLKWMLDNDITDVMDLNFIAEVNSFGVVKVIELIPGGTDILVTEENKHKYVQLISEFKMTATIEKQIQAFLKGFYELIPKKFISLFNELELELLISGLPDIDVEDMRRNTEYTGYRADSPIIQYFWNTVKRFTQEERALLLQFVTGSSKVPLDGFAALQGMGGPQKFRIVKIAGETDRLPSAHTCFNQLDMPEYTSEEELERKLTIAIKETSGFGFG